MEDIRYYLEKIKHFAILSSKETDDLIAKAREGDKLAEEKLIEANLKLVISITKHYFNRGVSTKDLIQQGNVGLIKAIKNFDPSKGYKLSSFAFKWIKNEMLEVFKKETAFSFSDRARKNISKYKKAKEKLHQKLEREPTIGEIAKKLNKDKKEILKLKALEEIEITPMDTIEESHINQSIDDSPARNVSSELARERFVTVTSILSKKEKEIFFLRFGINEGVWSKEEVMKKFGISREGLRKMENRIYAKVFGELKRRAEES